MVEQFTPEVPLKPEIVRSIRNMEQLFAHYKPQVDVMLDNIDGGVRKETIEFKSIEDFAPEKLVEQSNFLKQTIENRTQYLKIMRQLKSNDQLKRLVADPEARKAFLDAISNLIEELNSTK
jgi:predicted component of type VI protein secretion system